MLHSVVIKNTDSGARLLDLNPSLSTYLFGNLGKVI